MRPLSTYHLPKLILVLTMCAVVGGALLGALSLSTGLRLFSSEGAFIGYLGIGLIVVVADRLIARWDDRLIRRAATPAAAIRSESPVEDDRRS